MQNAMKGRTATRKSKSAKPAYKKQDNIAGYVLIAPWLFGFLLMWLVPALISHYYSFTNYNMLSSPTWVGMSNYVRIFTADNKFRQALSVTFSYVLLIVPLRLAFALFVASQLNKKHLASRVWRESASGLSLKIPSL